MPVLIAAAFLGRQWWVKRAQRYVAGENVEGITRSLDRDAQQGSTPIRFTDVTRTAGIRFHHAPFRRTSQLPEDMGSGVAWGDYDGDGLVDLFFVNFAAPIGVSAEEMASSAATDRLYRNRGDGTFEDVTARAGVGVAHRGMGAAWGDFDADGDRDLFVTSWGENLLWENLGDGTFRDVTRRAGMGGEGFWTGASWADFDRDGDLDLYVCGYVRYVPEKPGAPATRSGAADFPFTLNPSSYPPAINRFYVNRGDGTFDERAVAAGVLGEKGRSLSAAWADFDDDGLPDIYVANDVSDNLLYRNKGDGTFEDLSYPALVADYRGAMGIAIGDWDADLDLDIFLTHWIAQENAMYSNMTATAGPRKLIFADEADRIGLGQISLDLIGWGTALVDLDHDGLLDLFVSNGSTFQKRDDPSKLVPMPAHLYWNRGPQKGFFEIGKAAGVRIEGVGRGAAFADYDRDGDLDLALVLFGESARLLRNDTRGGHWITLQLRQRSGHSSGVGSKVIVRAGGKAFLREAEAGPSYLSQNEPSLNIGIGAATKADSVEVRWLGGKRDAWTNLDADATWLLEEGAPPRRLGAAPTLEEKKRFWELDRNASRLYGEGKWSEAAKLFEQMSELDPTHEDALYSLGNCLLELGRYEEAKRAWERLLARNPSSSRAWVQIGVLRTILGSTLFDLDEAVAAFRTAHRINREESRPLSLLGEAELARGSFAEARESLSAAHRMNPGESSALYLSGYLAWKRGDARRARELLTQTLQSFQTVMPIAGASNEGDVRTSRMKQTLQNVGTRRLFADCVEKLRGESDPTPDRVFPCVDRVLAKLRAG